MFQKKFMNKTSDPWIYVYLSQDYPTNIEIEEIKKFLNSDNHKNISYLFIFPKNTRLELDAKGARSKTDKNKDEAYRIMWSEALALANITTIKVVVNAIPNLQNIFLDPISYYGINIVYFSKLDLKFNLKIYVPSTITYDKTEQMPLLKEFNKSSKSKINEVIIHKGSKSNENKIELREKEFLNYLKTAKTYSVGLDEFIPTSNNTKSIYEKFSEIYPAQKYLLVIDYFMEENTTLMEIQNNFLLNEISKYKRCVFFISNYNDKSKMENIKKMFSRFGVEIVFVTIDIKNLDLESISNYFSYNVTQYMTPRAHILFSIYELVDSERNNNGKIMYPMKCYPKIVKQKINDYCKCDHLHYNLIQIALCQQ